MQWLVIHSTRSDTMFPSNFAEYSRFGKTFQIKVVDLNDYLYFMTHAFKASEGKSEGKRTLSKSRRQRKYTIKIQLTETERGIELRTEEKWWALVHTAMASRVL